MLICKLNIFLNHLALLSTVVPAIECDVRAGKINLPEFIVKCPAHCKETKQQVYGTGVFASISSICNAAIHRLTAEWWIWNKAHMRRLYCSQSCLLIVVSYKNVASAVASSPTQEERWSWGSWPGRTSTKAAIPTECGLCLFPSGGSRLLSQVLMMK